MKGSNPKAAEHYSKCKSRWNQIPNLGRCGGTGMGRMGHRERREETRSRIMIPQAWSGNPHGAVETLGSLKSRLFSLPLKIKTSHSLKNVQTRSFAEAT